MQRGRRSSSQPGVPQALGELDDPKMSHLSTVLRSGMATLSPPCRGWDDCEGLTKFSRCRPCLPRPRARAGHRHRAREDHRRPRRKSHVLLRPDKQPLAPQRHRLRLHASGVLRARQPARPNALMTSSLFAESSRFFKAALADQMGCVAGDYDSHALTVVERPANSREPHLALMTTCAVAPSSPSETLAWGLAPNRAFRRTFNLSHRSQQPRMRGRRAQRCRSHTPTLAWLSPPNRSAGVVPGFARGNYQLTTVELRAGEVSTTPTAARMRPKNLRYPRGAPPCSRRPCAAFWRLGSVPWN